MLAERRATATRSHVGHLPDLTKAVLREAGFELADVDAVAVSIGPGSFTGLRIGVAFAKGLAYAGRIALIGVSTLEAHAHCARRDGASAAICVANDARKGEVYAALFDTTASGVERRWPDAAYRPDALLRRLPAGALVVGDAVAILTECATTAGGSIRTADIVPSGAVVGCLGAAALARGEEAGVGELEPSYVREPDATLPATPLR